MSLKGPTFDGTAAKSVSGFYEYYRCERLDHPGRRFVEDILVPLVSANRGAPDGDLLLEFGKWLEFFGWNNGLELHQLLNEIDYIEIEVRKIIKACPRIRQLVLQIPSAPEGYELPSELSERKLSSRIQHLALSVINFLNAGLWIRKRRIRRMDKRLKEDGKTIHE